MKFEIELTEEEAREYSDNLRTPMGISAQIRAQLPKEKRYKFLVGYINPNGDTAPKGQLCSEGEKSSYFSEIIYGFTEYQLETFLRWSCRYKEVACTFAKEGRDYLQTQEAK